MQQFIGMTAYGKGSFLYLAAANAPVLTMTLTLTMFKCNNADFCPSQTLFGTVYQ
jgi:hypothetical protein